MFDGRLNQLERKHYGRIFVEKEEDIAVVEDVMREIDEDEFKWYYPTRNFRDPEEELIAVFSEENLHSVYGGKFEMDLAEVCIRAWKRGVKCFYVKGRITGFEE